MPYHRLQQGESTYDFEKTLHIEEVPSDATVPLEYLLSYSLAKPSNYEKCSNKIQLKSESHFDRSAHNSATRLQRLNSQWP